MGNTSVFDSKIFNGEVFKGYIDRIPNPTRKELIRSRALRPRPDLAAAMADQDGGNYITTTMRGLINNTEPQNYDGETDLVSSNTTTYRHSRIVVGRGASWTEKDFSYDITGGEDFLENIAQQIAEYWEGVDQATIIDILSGVFAMSDEAGMAFVESHTHDVTAVENSEGVIGKMDGTTLNTCMQKACGDNKAAFSLAIMHSAVATNLENLKLLVYLKYNDANGMQRDLAIGTLNGRTVLVDDSMPTETNEAGTAYTTFVLGECAIEYTDCGVKVPYEVDRDPAKNGGQDTLYSRQRKCFAPFGISFTCKSMAKASPVSSELRNGANWELVNNAAAENKQYINTKSIPIARIISLG